MSLDVDNQMTPEEFAAWYRKVQDDARVHTSFATALFRDIAKLSGIAPEFTVEDGTLYARIDGEDVESWGVDWLAEHWGSGDEEGAWRWMYRWINGSHPYAYLDTLDSWDNLLALLPDEYTMALTKDTAQLTVDGKVYANEFKEGSQLAAAMCVRDWLVDKGS